MKKKIKIKTSRIRLQAKNSEVDLLKSDSKNFTKLTGWRLQDLKEKRVLSKAWK